jgi:hypothetical protein
MTGCDTIVTINVTVDPYETLTVNESFCAGDSVQVYGIWYTAPNTYMDTISGTGCDTVVTINIAEDPLLTLTINESHCPGDSVNRGNWYIVQPLLTRSLLRADVIQSDNQYPLIPM